MNKGSDITLTSKAIRLGDGDAGMRDGDVRMHIDMAGKQTERHAYFIHAFLL